MHSAILLKNKDIHKYLIVLCPNNLSCMEISCDVHQKLTIVIYTQFISIVFPSINLTSSIMFIEYTNT